MILLTVTGYANNSLLCMNGIMTGDEGSGRAGRLNALLLIDVSGFSSC